VLLLVDVLAGVVLHAMQLLTLGLGDGAVRLVLGFDAGDVRLLLVKPVRLARRELPGRDPGVDARLLGNLAVKMCETSVPYNRSSPPPSTA
jgi:hypothetical protein